MAFTLKRKIYEFVTIWLKGMPIDTVRQYDLLNDLCRSENRSCNHGEDESQPKDSLRYVVVVKEMKR